MCVDVNGKGTLLKPTGMIKIRKMKDEAQEEDRRRQAERQREKRREMVGFLHPTSRRGT